MASACTAGAAKGGAVSPHFHHAPRQAAPPEAHPDSKSDVPRHFGPLKKNSTWCGPCFLQTEGTAGGCGVPSTPSSATAGILTPLTGHMEDVGLKPHMGRAIRDLLGSPRQAGGSPHRGHGGNDKLLTLLTRLVSGFTRGTGCPRAAWPHPESWGEGAAPLPGFAFLCRPLLPRECVQPSFHPDPRGR